MSWCWLIRYSNSANRDNSDAVLDGHTQCGVNYWNTFGEYYWQLACGLWGGFVIDYRVRNFIWNFELFVKQKSFNWFRLEFRIKLKSWMKLLTLIPNSPRLLCACLSVTINKFIKGKCVIGRAVHNRIPNVHVTRDCSDGKQFSSCDNATLPLVITIIHFCFFQPRSTQMCWGITSLRFLSTFSN